MSKFVVTLSASELRNSENSSYPTIITNQRLRALGVPMVGKLMLYGVEHGTLTLHRNEAGDMIYEWIPDPRSNVPEDYDFELDGPIQAPQVPDTEDDEL